jgi:ABC-type lipoprotein release transport system permease subunit
VLAGGPSHERHRFRRFRRGVTTYVAALGVILAAAVLASYLPARRASAIDPVETLKAE